MVIATSMRLTHLSLFVCVDMFVLKQTTINISLLSIVYHLLLFVKNMCQKVEILRAYDRL